MHKAALCIKPFYIKLFYGVLWCFMHRSFVAFFEINTEHPLWQNLFDNLELIALHVDSRIDDIELYLHIL